jgi:hypothetical protein
MLSLSFLYVKQLVEGKTDPTVLRYELNHRRRFQVKFKFEKDEGPPVVSIVRYDGRV